MRDISFYIKLAIGMLLVLLVSGCEKAPINNAVEQHWMLEQFTIRENNQVVKCERLFYGITRMVTVVSEKQGTHGYGTFVARTEYQDDKKVLVLKDFKVRNSGYGNSGVYATPEQMMPYGIINPKETVFQIVKSTHKHLILESDYARLELRKF